MIYAIGDSFTAGAELEGHLWDTPGQGAWPEVLESLINHPVINKGRSATGNTRIVKRSIDAVLEKADGIVICWTYSLRIEFIDDVDIYDVTTAKQNLWWLFRKSNTDHRSILVEYLNRYQSSYKSRLYAYKNWLRQVILVQNLCKCNDIPYVMLIAFGAKNDIEDFGDDEVVKYLTSAIDQTKFVNNTLNESTLDWIAETEKMPGGHPGLDGHKIIANKIYEHIRNIGWIPRRSN